ncbi:gamma-aminobutyric acid type B receptor subunit 2-like [Asterias amurensis]|uniref:gamma-aminobutyric acid type B receptor subunit 2-like n=1 Tax=Asterias amurensis TaxID=7602 RepID=UPI003AB58FB5
MLHFLATVLILTSFRGPDLVNAKNKSALHIGGLLPLSPKDGWSRSNGYPALLGAKRAIADINNRSDVLPDYELVLHMEDNEVNLPVALDRLYVELLGKPPTKVAILGPLLSKVAETVAQVIGRWSIVEITPGGSSSVFSNRDRYPHIYRILTSASLFGSAQAAIIRQFGWTRIATLNEAVEPHKGRIKQLHDESAHSNFSIVSSETFITDPEDALKRLKDIDVRIIATAFYEGKVRKVFCTAYKLGMYGPDYVWMILGLYMNGWQYVEDEMISCTTEELLTASEGYLAITFSFYGQEKDVGRGGQTPAEFRKDMSDLLGYNISVTDPTYAANCYDAIWALALAFDKAEPLLSRSLDSYEYHDEEYANIVGQCILNQTFAGMSGYVSFHETGYRIGNLLIEQNIAGTETHIGTFDTAAIEITWSIPAEDIWYYSDGKPPHDSDITVVIFDLQATPLPTLMVMSVLAVLGMVLAVLFLGFNIWKRQHKQVKMSSPQVNNLIACGFIFAYLSVVLLGIDNSMVGKDTLVSICVLRTWIISLGFTLSFGGMFTKMWRVYSIVIANKTKRKVIKDRHLFAVIAVLLLVDLAILIPWQVANPMRTEDRREPVVQTEEHLSKKEKHVVLYVNCTSENSTVWTTAILIYKTFIVVFGAFLAWSTRNINVPGLNDSYYVGLSIYNTVICCVVAVPLSFLTASSIGVTFALVSVFLLFCITASLCMLFFPKVIAVYRPNEVAGTPGTGIMIGTAAAVVVQCDTI